MKRIDAVIGMGEVGSALYQVLTDHTTVNIIGDDAVPAKAKPIEDIKKPVRVGVLHICFPYTPTFINAIVQWFNVYPCKELVIHSTVKPLATQAITNAFSTTGVKVVVVYSPVRGNHTRMSDDLMRYTKFWASTEEPACYLREMKQCGIKVERMSNTTVLEMAKIYVDTSYYGWLILYAQHTKEVCDSLNQDWEEMWKFSDEIQQFLGNRPKMFPGEGIDGHCVLPNLALINDEFLDVVFAHDQHYRRHIR